MLKVVLFLLIVGCSVSDESGVANSTTEAEAQQQGQVGINNEDEFPDLDSDLIEDEIELELGLDPNIPDKLTFKVSTLNFSFENTKPFSFLSVSKFNMANMYHKILSLEKGSVEEYEFVKSSNLYEFNGDEFNFYGDLKGNCANGCKLRINFKLIVQNSFVLKEFNNIEMSLKLYDKLTGNLNEIKSKLIVDPLKDPVFFEVGSNNGASTKSFSMTFDIDEQTYLSLGRKNSFLLFGLKDVAMNFSDKVVSYKEYINTLEANNKTVSFLIDDEVKSYQASDEVTIKSLIEEDKSLSYRFDDRRVYMVNETFNSMLKVSPIREIEKENLKKGIWRVNHDNFDLTELEMNSYYISFITNEDRLFLSEKSYLASEGLTTSFKLSDISPYDALVVEMSKYFTSHRELGSSTSHNTTLYTRGNKKCFETYTDQSCDPGGGVGGNTNSMPVNYKCNPLPQCIDEDYGTKTSNYSCTVNNVGVESYEDNSRLVLDTEVSIKDNSRVYLLSNMFQDKALSNNRTMLKLMLNRDKSLNGYSLFAPPVSKSLRTGYLNNNCKKRCEGTATSRYSYDCVAASPSVGSSAVAKKYNNQNNIKFKVWHRSIERDPHFETED